MKVRDLIDALAALDPELEVIIPSRLHDAFSLIEKVALDVGRPTREAFEVCDYDDQSMTPIVRLFEIGEHDDRAERPKPPSH